MTGASQKIQHSQADLWQESLEKMYGVPQVHKNDYGTETDRFWKFKYNVDDRVTEITMHIYNKPKNKKASKLMIQSGSQPLICIYVFTELPKIYRDVCDKIQALCDNTQGIKKQKKKKISLIKCGKCNVQATLNEMKMHLKRAHTKPRSTRRSKTVENKDMGNGKIEFHCDKSECEYKTNEKSTLNKHVDAVHVIPLKLNEIQENTGSVMRQHCGQNVQGAECSDKHIQKHHSNIIEEITLEEELSLEDNSDTGFVAERECYTPVPQNIFICGECNIGLESEQDIETHMEMEHGDCERIKRLEAELRHEKSQHQDHVDILEETLNKVKDLEKNIVELMKTIEIKDKQLKKSEEKHRGEVSELKKEQMLTSEKLRSTVLERENLRENDRILLNTFDMMKKHIDQVRDNVEKNNGRKCDGCESGSNKKDALNDPDTQVFHCTKCKFESKTQNDLEKHISTEHGKHQCQDCENSFNSKSELNEHTSSMHRKDKLFECDKCQFDTIIENNFKFHTSTEHWEHQCQICVTRFSSKNELNEHIINIHRKEKPLECDKCQFDTIIENNFKLHMDQHNHWEVNNSKKNVKCIYWNHGYCRNGKSCIFVHEEIPACPDQESCRNFKCSLFHFDKSMNTFLGRTPRRGGSHQSL